jgi:hypothetical protein
MTKRKFSADLQDFLKSEAGQNIKSVWINDAGEWYFHAKTGCEKIASSEIIALDVQEIEEEGEHAEKPAKKAKK